MRHSKIIITVVIATVIGLQSSSQEVLQSLKEIDERLERSIRMADSILWESDRRMDSVTRNIHFIGFDPAVADSLSKLLNQTSRLLVRLRNELNDADTAGAKLDIAQNLLINNPTGDSLSNYMMRIYEASGMVTRVHDAGILNRENMIKTNGLINILKWYRQSPQSLFFQNSGMTLRK